MNQLESLNPRGLVVLLSFIAVISIYGCSQAHATSDENRAAESAWSAPSTPTDRGKASKAQIIGSRPAGCPSLYCGCALSIKLFGRIITSPNLKLAATWRSAFPRTSAAPGMVAVKPGGSHVLQLISQVQGNRWLVWTANSCKGHICIQERSVAGYVFLNPLASRMASR